MLYQICIYSSKDRSKTLLMLCTAHKTRIGTLILSGRTFCFIDQIPRSKTVIVACIGCFLHTVQDIPSRYYLPSVRNTPGAGNGAGQCRRSVSSYNSTPAVSESHLSLSIYSSTPLLERGAHFTLHTSKTPVR